MKKIVVSLIALLAISLQAQTDIAIGGDIALFIQSKSDNGRGAAQIDVEEKTTDVQFRVIPTVIIGLADNYEIAPFGGMGITSKSVTDIVPGIPNSTKEETNVSAGIGCAFGKRLVDTDLLRVAPGGDVQAWFTNNEGPDNGQFDISIGVPISITLKLGPRVHIRTSPRVASIGVKHENRVGTDGTTTVTFMDLKSLWTPNVGFYFVF